MIQISLKFVPRGPFDNKAALVQVMAWRRTDIIWTNPDTIHWRIYVTLGGDELTEPVDVGAWMFNNIPLITTNRITYLLPNIN